MIMTPGQFKTNNIHIKDSLSFNELCVKIDSKLRSTSLVNENNVNTIIEGEFSKELREQIVIAYMNAGWSKVEHHTSSENGERSGLTQFTFWF